MFRTLTTAWFIALLAIDCANAQVVVELNGRGPDDASDRELSTDLHLDYGAALAAAAEEIAPADPFAQGSWVWHAYGSFDFASNDGTISTANFGAGYHFYDAWSINFDIGGSYIDNMLDPGKDAGGVVINCILRWHLWRHERWTVFADGSFGMSLYSQEFPTYGTNFNFVWQVGMGATYQLNPDLYLMGGMRWVHISNGDFFGGSETNPGYDGAQVWLGLMWPF
jgi:opacity protein-like surface antigen